MLRVAFRGWEAAFSERADGDLRVSARATRGRAARARSRSACSARSASRRGRVGRQVHGAGDRSRSSEPPARLRASASREARRRRDDAAGRRGRRPRRRLPADRASAATGGVAMLHGGWRGLAGGIVAEGVRTLRELGVRGRSRRRSGRASAAAATRPGEEVRERFARLRARAHGRLLDLKAVAAAQLREAGVERVEDVGAVHDLRDAGTALLAPPRRAPRPGARAGSRGCAERRAGARAASPRCASASTPPRQRAGRDPAAVEILARRQVRRRRRTSRRSPTPASRWSARTARRTCSRRSRTRRGACAGTSSARCSRARSARSCRTSS